MSSSNKLSLTAAILINLNIMLGSGVFINTVLLTASAGALGGAVYVVVALLLLPLIFAISELMKENGGTFYDFGALIHPLMGFIMSWSYFVAKLASCALGIHVFVSLMQILFPLLQAIPVLLADVCMLSFFTALNLGNLRLGRRIQYGFIALKLIPLLFIIISALFYFNANYFTAESFQWSGIIDSIPFVIFAFGGFEASCSLSKSLENPEKNGPRAILISYILVLAIVVLYQTGFFSILGQSLGALRSFCDAYPAVISLFYNNTLLWKALTLIGIASSSLGASYGIMYSNSWNLYTLAQKKHTFLSDKLIQFNKYAIPFWCILIEGAAAIMYVIATKGYQVPLQQISAFGSTIAYCGCSLVFIYQSFTYKKYHLLATANLISCCLLITGIIRNGLTYGITAYLFFLVVIIAGIGMFYATRSTKKLA